VGEVTADDLLSSDAVIVGSPVYFGNMAGEVKTFFDNWLLKFDFLPGVQDAK
jgi:NAD(P)H dehydrogenase (quinone)